MRKIAIFCDGSNFGEAVKAAGYRVDYQKLREYFAQYGEIVASFYCTALPPKTVTSTIRNLTNALQYKGWTLITKETKKMSTPDGFRLKGNVDIDLVIQAIRLLDSESITDLILLSGDGDFTEFVRYMRDNGVRVRCISHQSQDDRNIMSDDLRRVCSEYLDLREIRRYVEMEDVVKTRRMNFLNGN